MVRPVEGMPRVMRFVTACRLEAASRVCFGGVGVMSSFLAASEQTKRYHAPARKKTAEGLDAGQVGVVECGQKGGGVMAILGDQAGGRSVSATPWAIQVIKTMDPRERLAGAAGGAMEHFHWLLFAIALWGYGKVRVASVRRSLEEQRGLYGRGRSGAECERAGVPREDARPGEAKVTWSLPEKSKHLSGHAMDLDWGAYGEVRVALMKRTLWMMGLDVPKCWSKGDYGHVEF